MASFLRFSLLALTLVCFAACGEDEVRYEFPESSTEHITFTIDGQELSLKGINSYSRNRISLHDDQRNDLHLSRVSADGLTTLSIYGSNLPLARDGESVTWNGGEEYAAVNITVAGSTMSGSIYCPHVEGVDVVGFQALMIVDKINGDGTIQGRFETDPTATGNTAELTDGSFFLSTHID